MQELEDRLKAWFDLEAQVAAAKKEQTAASAASASTRKKATAAPSASPPLSIPVTSALDSLPAPVLDDDLLLAIRAGHLSELQQLLSANYQRPVLPGDARYRPLLYEAVSHKQEDVVTFLLESSHSLEEVDEQVLDAEDQRHIVCWGPLHRACQLNLQRSIRLLLQHGADPTKRDSRQRLPFSLLTSAEARLAARRLAGSSEQMLQRCNWAEAELPPLTPEAEAAAEEAKRAKAREKKKAKKEKANTKKAEEAEEKKQQEQRDVESMRQAIQAKTLGRQSKRLPLLRLLSAAASTGAGGAAKACVTALTYTCSPSAPPTACRGSMRWRRSI
jgi:hypothetical protein